MEAPILPRPVSVYQAELSHVLARIFGLRREFATSAPISVLKMDVANAFRKIPVDPSQAAIFSHVAGNFW